MSGGRLAENVMHFARALRAAGMPVGPDRVLDALAALQMAGVERREDWYATLACLFLTRREHKPLFDQAFAIFWRDPALLERMMALLLPSTTVRGDAPEQPVNRRLAEALAPQSPWLPERKDAEEKVDIKAEISFSANERLQYLDFEEMSKAEWDATKRLVAQLRLPIPPAATRRFDRAQVGARIDLRATLASLVKNGGDVLTLQRRKRRFRPPPLVVLADISGSMHRYTRMFLYFLHALARDREAVSVLTFGTRLTNVTRSMRYKDVDVAIADVGRKVQDWAGGTRIHASVREFNHRWSRRLLAQNAVVLLITDGLDREVDVGLGDEMARLHRSCRRLIWLNPLLRYDGFQAKPAGIRAMLPHVDDFLPVHNLESLHDLIAQLRHR
jgi:uncharacterized protein